MKRRPFRKTNHWAIAGFLLPFAAAALMALLVVLGEEDLHRMGLSIWYFTAIPALLAAGLVASIKSIPLIPERNDRDYAYSGLTMNLLFIFVYITSLVYLFTHSGRAG